MINKKEYFSTLRKRTDYSVAIVDLSGDDKNLFSPNFNVNFLKYSNVN